MENEDVIEVTIKKKYIIEKGINGCTPDQIANEWFLENNINQSHASRDYYHIGNGDKVIEISINGNTYYNTNGSAKLSAWQKIKKLFRKRK